MKKLAFVCALALFVLAGCGGKKVVEINGVSDLKGKNIGVQAGTTGETWCQENSGALSVASFKSGMDAAIDLKNGYIDAIVLDELPAKAIVEKNPSLTILHDPTFAENKEEYAIAIKKGNAELLDSVNRTINMLKTDGGYEALVAAFMPADGEIKVPAFTEQGFPKTLKLGTNAAFPPFEYVDGSDIVGFDISMGHLIAVNYQSKLEVVDMAFDSLIPALQAGTIDFIAAGMSVTEERKKNVDFSDPYFASEQVIIIRK